VGVGEEAVVVPEPGIADVGGLDGLRTVTVVTGPLSLNDVGEA
jgi:hypothetical protein